ncbi:multiple C2 and transmembrane domain-containing protein 2 [Lampris incognitus]|uniref:multiple C2 and transmembrane domain-containing protein 2 n=1 Tax=Lampris incognitus TaxID=2546036 RepID=UPI0024B62445|nr:multiple C2 and transmembrane domain-containing protein 2 [Lampris incognitus]
MLLNMEPKKKNFFDNFRLKTKMPNLKKPGKKGLGRQGMRLGHRYSISVPDLRLLPSEPSPTPSALDYPQGRLSTDSPSFFFGTSPGQSDTDSIASSSITNEPPSFADTLSDSVSLTRYKVPMDDTDSFDNLISPPVMPLTHYEEVEDVRRDPSSEGKGNLSAEPVYAQVNKPPKTVKGNVPRPLSLPVPSPRTVLTNINAPLPHLALSGDQENLSTERLYNTENTSTERVNMSSGGITAALARASSFGEHANLHTEKQPSSNEQIKLPPERGTPPAIREDISYADRWSRPVPRRGTPMESADGTSLDSAGDTPSEERVNMPWTTDSEELDRDFLSPQISEALCMEEPLLEGSQLEEVWEEAEEMSSEHSELFDKAMQDLSDISVLTPGLEVPAAVALQRYLLTINLKEGRNLTVKRKRSGTSYPYVKFKLEGKQFYKSKVMSKNLNPRWNESFSHPLRDREHSVEVRVYDKTRTTDDFMGSNFISLKNLDLNTTYEMELHLNDPKSKEDNLGVIIVDVCLMFREATIKRSPRWPPKKNKGGQQQNQIHAVAQPQRSSETQKNQLKSQCWTGVFGITLVEGQDMPRYGQGDIYVRFRLADQKYKSKNLCIQANPQWREQFDFNQFEENQEPLQVEVFSNRGKKCEESWGMVEVDLSRLPVNERQLYTRVLDPGKGRLVFLVTLKPCWGVSISDIHSAPLEQPDERDMIMGKFSLKNSHKCVREIGFLQVKVIKAADLPAADLNGKSDPYCVIELGNSKLQTQTIYKTLNPEWNKVFTFPIKDIHDVIELTVLDENGDKAPNFLGKVMVPLLSVQNGQQTCMFLKKEDLGRLSKGTITLELEVIYNKVRAGVRTFQPKETKFTEDNLKFSKKVLAQNIYRVRKISTAVLYTLQYIKSCFQWESTQQSLIAFLIFLVTVFYWELFMLPLFLLLLISWNYFQFTSGRANSNQDLVNMSMTDDEDEDEKESGKKSLMEKIRMVQEVVITVQSILDEIASMGERVKNTFNWSVPFLSWLACLVLFVATVLLYSIPLRYIVLVWGVNKFTKKLRNPHAIDNNGILDFLERVPSDVQKVQYSELRAPSIQSTPRRRR